MPEWWGLGPRPAGRLLAACPHVAERARGLSGVCFIRALVPLRRARPSALNHFSQLHSLRASPLGLKSSTCGNFRGTRIQTTALPKVTQTGERVEFHVIHHFWQLNGNCLGYGDRSKPTNITSPTTTETK